MLIKNIQKVFSVHGNHCAFTDIITFKGSYYIGFMMGIEHMVNSANKSIVISSSDGINYKRSVIFYTGVDTREPKFMVFDNKLWAYFFTIHPSSDGCRMLTESWCSYTEDGESWTEPVMFSKGDKFWRPVAHGRYAYCMTHPKDPAPDKPCRLMHSADGFNWELISDIPIDPMQKPNEACITFDNSDNIFIFIRSDMGKANAYVLKTAYPYKEFEVYNMNQRFGGPLIWLHENTIYLGARFYTDAKIPHTGIFVLDKNMQPKLVTVLPSMGDSSYMGITKKIDSSDYLISYYSSHESLNGDMFSRNCASIYIAEVNLND